MCFTEKYVHGFFKISCTYCPGCVTIAGHVFLINSDRLVSMTHPSVMALGYFRLIDLISIYDCDPET